MSTLVVIVICLIERRSKEGTETGYKFDHYLVKTGFRAHEEAVTLFTEVYLNISDFFM